MAPNDILLDTGILGPGTTPNPGGVRNLDFDVMEIANGAKVGDYPSYLQMREDWFSLLAQNAFKPGTGVSDSHRITVEHAGWSRTYVLGAGDDPANLDVAAFDAAVKAGRMVVSAGPWSRRPWVAEEGRRARRHRRQQGTRPPQGRRAEPRVDSGRRGARRGDPRLRRRERRGQDVRRDDDGRA
jgi:hypothetical protein